MSTTEINISTVMQASGTIANAKMIAANAHATADSVRYQVDGRVKGRANIGGRLNSVAGQLADIEGRVAQIRNLVEGSASRYNSTENYVMEMSKGIQECELLAGLRK